jgi:hypothetical protein
MRIRRFRRKVHRFLAVSAVVSALFAIPFGIATIALADRIPSIIESKYQANRSTPKYYLPKCNQEFQGRVVDDATGSPVEGASIRVFVKYEDSIIPRVFSHTVETRSDGSFQFVVPIDDDSKFDEFSIDVGSADHLRRILYLPTFDFNTDNDISIISKELERIVIRRSRAIRGRLIKPDGESASGVDVVVYSPNNELKDEYRYRTKTDKEGRFQAFAAAKSKFLLVTSSNDFAETYREFSENRRGDLGDLNVVEGIEVSAYVYDKKGDPAPFIDVQASVEAENEDDARRVFKEYDYNISPYFRMHTDMNGKILFRAPDHGELYFMVIQTNTILLKDFYMDCGCVYKNRTIRLKNSDKRLRLNIIPENDAFIRVQEIDACGFREYGYATNFNISGEIEGQGWGVQWKQATDRIVQVRVPHGLMNAYFHTDVAPHHGLKYRFSNQKDYRYALYSVDLGTLDHDVDRLEIARIVWPRLIVKVIDEKLRSINDIRLHGSYVKNQEAPSREDIVFPITLRDDGSVDSVYLLPGRNQTISVEAGGYEPASQTVILDEGERRVLEFVLKKKIKP